MTSLFELAVAHFNKKVPKAYLAGVSFVGSSTLGYLSRMEFTDMFSKLLGSHDNRALFEHSVAGFGVLMLMSGAIDLLPLPRVVRNGLIAVSAIGYAKFCLDWEFGQAAARGSVQAEQFLADTIGIGVGAVAFWALSRLDWNRKAAKAL